MNGIFIVDKPSDWTSHDVVSKLRGITGERRIGHSGTLDPMATGVLVVFVGRATRAVEFAEADKKEYEAGLRLGMKTDTQDTTGTILEQKSISINDDELETVLNGFRGNIQQIPPMYSAIKVNGRKLYDLARKGIEIERRPRDVKIEKLIVSGRDGEDYLLDIVCSKGTYVRTLCNDIGNALGCGGCMSSLRRIRAGVFGIDRANTIEQIAECPEKFLLPVDTIFEEYPRISADGMQEKKIRNGNEFPIDADSGNYRFYSQQGEFLMLGRVENGTAYTIKSFFEV